MARRFVTVPAVWLFTALITAAWPALVLLGFAFDLLRRRTALPSVRVATFAVCFGFIESLGIVSLAAVGLLTLGRHAARLKQTYAVQRLYTGALFTCARVLLALRFEVKGDALVDRGPLLVFARHASILDTLMPAVFLANRHRLELRYVLKRELRFGPCLDIAGHWLPNHFVARGGTDSAGEIAAIAALKHGLEPGQGVLIYPEGTRFSPARRERALAAVDPSLRARAEALVHLLPPRLGGALALLSAAPPCDVLILAHHGLESFRTVADIWAGHLVGKTVRVELFRVPAAEIPQGREAQTAFLYEQWKRLDDWVRQG